MTRRRSIRGQATLEAMREGTRYASYEFESIFSQFFGLPAITLSSSSQMTITY